MSGAVISRVDIAAAHDGDAELLVTLSFENGGRTQVALDAHATRHLMESCGAPDAETLVGHSWEHVRNALQAASSRFADNR